MDDRGSGSQSGVPASSDSKASTTVDYEASLQAAHLREALGGPSAGLGPQAEALRHVLIGTADGPVNAQLQEVLGSLGSTGVPADVFTNQAQLLALAGKGCPGQ